jgi:hypothetical protein
MHPPLSTRPDLQVSTYLLQGHTRGQDTGTTNWAIHRGIARINGTTTLCFSRPINSSVPMTLHQVRVLPAPLAWRTARP